MDGESGEWSEDAGRGSLVGGPPAGVHQPMRDVFDALRMIVYRAETRLAAAFLRTESGRQEQNKCGSTASQLADPRAESPVVGLTTAVPRTAKCW